MSGRVDLAARAAKRRAARPASLHVSRAQDIASEKRAFAGNADAASLWALSKRELIEAALHLAALCTDSYDGALEDGAAAERVHEELDALDAAGML